MPSKCVVHDVVELDEQGVWVQHGIDLVEHEKYQLTLLSHRSIISVHGLGVPILQQAHEVRPFLYALDAYIELVGWGPPYQQGWAVIS